MKKALFILLVAFMSMALLVPAFAVDFDVPMEYVKHISYDEVRPGIVCGQDTVKINEPEFASGTASVQFWGWIVVDDAEIAGFSYSVNGGAKKTDASFKVAAEDAVIAAGSGFGSSVSRFLVTVPVSEGTQLVRVFADLDNGESEVYWIAEVTVGEASDYEDGNGGTTTDPEPSDPTNPDDNKPSDPTDNPENPPKTGDASVVFAVAAAGIAMTALLKKKICA